MKSLFITLIIASCLFLNTLEMHRRLRRKLRRTREEKYYFKCYKNSGDIDEQVVLNGDEHFTKEKSIPECFKIYIPKDERFKFSTKQKNAKDLFNILIHKERTDEQKANSPKLEFGIDDTEYFFVGEGVNKKPKKIEFKTEDGLYELKHFDTIIDPDSYGFVADVSLKAKQSWGGDPVELKVKGIYFFVNEEANKREIMVVIEEEDEKKVGSFLELVGGYVRKGKTNDAIYIDLDSPKFTSFDLDKNGNVSFRAGATTLTSNSPDLEIIAKKKIKEHGEDWKNFLTYLWMATNEGRVTESGFDYNYEKLKKIIEETYYP